MIGKLIRLDPNKAFEQPVPTFFRSNKPEHIDLFHLTNPMGTIHIPLGLGDSGVFWITSSLNEQKNGNPCRNRARIP
jgi:hypothetical protein